MGTRLTKKRNRTVAQEELLKNVRTYHAHQKIRIATNNAIKAMLRLGYIEEEAAEHLMEKIVGFWLEQEKGVVREAAKALKGMPIWEQWLKHVRGIANTLGVQLVAHIQPIADFDNVAKLWAYAGYSVQDGEAVRRRVGQQSDWNPDLKMIGFQVGDCFIRAGGPYRQLYDQYKARDREAHPEKTPILDKSGKPYTKNGSTVYRYTDGHIHNRARRYAIKIFLSHLWQAWREMENLPVRGPYAVEYLGHTTILSPWEFIDAEPVKA